MKPLTVSALLILCTLFPYMGSYAQEGFSWLRPLNTNSPINNNQYQCLYIGDNYSLDNGSIFDVNSHIGANDWIGIHAYIVKDFNNDGYCDAFFSFYSNETEKVPFKIFLYDSTIGRHVDKSHLILNNSVHNIFGKFSLFQLSLR